MFIEFLLKVFKKNILLKKAKKRSRKERFMSVVAFLLQ
tara:strand:- start:11943 stop:12056 length:114 start_codon:yes stop_codon:yes gene_type:complete